MGKSAFIQYLLDNEKAFSAFKTVEALLIALAITSIIYLTYKLTYRGVVYNRNFNISLVMITLITTIVMMVIGSNIALSLGMVGALSIVRFRTAVKDPRDTAYIFWCIAVGLCLGTESYAIAVIGSLFISATVFLFSVGLKKDNKYLLVIRANRECEEEIMKNIFSLLKDYKVRAKNTTKENLEIIFEVRLRKNEDVNLMKTLYNTEGVRTVNIVAQTGEMIG